MEPVVREAFAGDTSDFGRAITVYDLNVPGSPCDLPHIRRESFCNGAHRSRRNFETACDLFLGQAPDKGGIGDDDLRLVAVQCFDDFLDWRDDGKTWGLGVDDADFGRKAIADMHRRWRPDLDHPRRWRCPRKLMPAPERAIDNLPAISVVHENSALAA